MNSEKSKTYDPHRLIRNISDEVDLEMSDKCIVSTIR